MGREFLAAGKSAIVYSIDEQRVVKEYYDDEYGDAAVEKQAFARLGCHPHIIRCFESGFSEQHKKNYLILERGQSLRLLLLADGTSAEDTRLHWILDAARGLAYLHASGIVHADVSCSNMVLVDDRVKLIDLEGCSIDGAQSTSYYSWYNSRGTTHAGTGTSATRQTDIFAFGCAIFEIATGHPPFAELASSRDRQPCQLARDRYAKGDYPNTDGILLADVVLACWKGEMESMDEVVELVQKRIDWSASPCIIRS